jgi:predicted RNA-binding Zn-ribbon protein involved in translation (DUF1610 family)
MRLELLCPACGVRDFDFDEYESLILFAPNLALVQFKCPCCGIHLSATLKLSATMRHQVRRMLDEKGIGDTETPGAQGASADPAPPALGSSPSAPPDPASAVPAPPAPAPVPLPTLCYSSSLIIEEGEPGIELIRPLRVGNADIRAHLEYFKRQLESIATVDEAIEEIGAGYYREGYEG